MFLDSNLIGHAELLSNKEVTAGETDTVEILYTAGLYGIEEGGHLRIAWRGVSDWQNPQFTSFAEEGYTTAETDADAELTLENSPYQRPYVNSLLIKVRNGYIKKGETIRITAGNRSLGSPGMRVQSYAEKNHEVLVLVDSFGTNRFEELKERIHINVKSGKLHEIQTVIPGSVVPGKEFSVLVRGLDEFGNPTDDFEDKISFAFSENVNGKLPKEVTITAKDKGSIRVNGFYVYENIDFHIDTKAVNHQLFSHSNASVSDSEQKYSLLWGDMHAQTADTVGTGSLDDYYEYARDKAGVDFTGWQGNDFDMDDSVWLDVKEKTKKYNEEGKFLVFLGYEWSAIAGIGGDHNVFFLNDDEEKFYSCSHWMSRGTLATSELAYTLSDLCKKYKDRDDVMLISHIGGRHANLDFYDKDLIRVIEIHSHHGIFEWFAMEAMKRHLRVGFIASSDDHTGRPGLSYPLNGNGDPRFYSFNVTSGLTGVFTEGKTRKEVWDAIKSRRCYASTSNRIYLRTDINGCFMGGEISTNAPLQFHVKAVGDNMIDQLWIYDWEHLVERKDLLTKSSNKVRIRWSGVMRRGRNRAACWNGKLIVKSGKIKNVTEYAFDRNDNGIVKISDKEVTWISSTTGDYDGIIIELDGTKDTLLEFYSEQGNVSCKLEEILKGTQNFSMGGENLSLEFDMAPEISFESSLSGQNIDLTVDMAASSKEHAYWVKLVQIDGKEAWSSPIFVN